MQNVIKLLNLATAAYAAGEPFLTDAEFDALATKYDYDDFHEGEIQKKAKHQCHQPDAREAHLDRCFVARSRNTSM